MCEGVAKSLDQVLKKALNGEFLPFLQPAFILSSSVLRAHVQPQLQAGHGELLP